jgi:LPXTG-site transpeptidase (sortase) family protein
MQKKWRTFRNFILLVAGLGIVGFSTYRMVIGFGQTDQDLVGGNEIVVISENTPVVSSTTSNSGPINQENFTANVPDSGPQVNPPESVPTSTGSLQDKSIASSGNSNLDTFLTQIKERPRNDQAEKNIPDRIVIPTIQLDAPVVVAGSRTVQVINETFDQWVAPNKFAGGWHGNTAFLGEKGNTVINGHHNEYGKVFGNLINLNPGETIYVYSGNKVYPYIISNKMILKEKNEDLQTRLSNASWIQPSNDERLTLITCWPPETNTHRLVIVAVPYITSPERVFG